MQLTEVEEAMLAGRDGPAKQRAMEGLVQLGRAFGARHMVEIGYAHIHAGMALYLEDVELMEELAAEGARMAVGRRDFPSRSWHPRRSFRCARAAAACSTRCGGYQRPEHLLLTRTTVCRQRKARTSDQRLTVTSPVEPRPRHPKG